MEILTNEKNITILQYDNILHLASFNSNIAKYDKKNNKLYISNEYFTYYNGRYNITEYIYKCSQATCKHLKYFINNYCQNLIEYKTIKQFEKDAEKNKNVYFIKL